RRARLPDGDLGAARPVDSRRAASAAVGLARVGAAEAVRVARVPAGRRERSAAGDMAGRRDRRVRATCFAMTNPSPAEAAEHLERAINEAQRLGEHFAQRTKDEKKRMGHLQQVVPKLKRLAKSLPIEKAVSDEEQKVLDSLKPAAKTG